jgi:L-lactate dehydrogenase
VCQIPYDIDKFNELFLEVKNAGYEIIKRKGRTFYAVALAMARIVASILRNENVIITVSCLLENYHGVSDVCLSVQWSSTEMACERSKLQLEDKELLISANQLRS